MIGTNRCLDCMRLLVLSSFALSLQILQCFEMVPCACPCACADACLIISRISSAGSRRNAGTLWPRLTDDKKNKFPSELVIFVYDCR